MDILQIIYNTVKNNKNLDPEISYSAKLFQNRKGINKVLEKINEEAGEVLIAAKDKDKHELIEELADLWFHTIALMEFEGVELQDLENILISRHKEAIDKLTEKKLPNRTESK